MLVLVLQKRGVYGIIIYSDSGFQFNLFFSFIESLVNGNQDSISKRDSDINKEDALGGINYV